MSREKQIEEMARDICGVKQSCNDVCHPINSCRALKYAERFYNAGYRKQEWISVDESLPTKAGKYLVYREAFACSITDMLYYDPNYMGHNDDMKNRAVWFSYDSEWGEYEIFGVSHWMPLPEAPKMKGGAE